MDKMYVQKMLRDIICIPPYIKGAFGPDENEALYKRKLLRQISTDFDFLVKNTENLSGPCKDIFALFKMRHNRKWGKKDPREDYNLADVIHF